MIERSSPNLFSQPKTLPVFQGQFQASHIFDAQFMLGNSDWTTNGPYGGGMFRTLAFDPNHQNGIYAPNRR
jgi:hypothetical protein